MVRWGVDIISLSFGYSSNSGDGYAEIAAAISRASKKALIFAAARNNGFNEGRAWPARERGVFCVYSTDSGGTWSPYNAPKMMHGSPNLAVVGEAVTSYWPSHLCVKAKNSTELLAKSGTSFATPIAASIVAFLIMFARTHLEPSEVENLRNFANMKAIIEGICLASVAKGHEAPKYSYLALNMKPDNLFAKDVEEIKKTIRDALVGRG